MIFQVNCLVELRAAEAIERAEALDEYFVEHQRPIGPLHGLPISTKEHMNMKAWDCNFAFVARVGVVASTDGLVMKTLYDAGANFFARTTEPQTLVSTILDAGHAKTDG